MRGLLVTTVIAAITCGLVPASAGAVTNPDDSPIAASGLLTLKDFPPGWTEAPRLTAPTPDLSRYGKTCAVIQRSRDAAKKLPVSHRRSPNFERSTALIN